MFQLASQGKKKEIISLLFGGLAQLWKGNSSLWWFWKSSRWKIPIDFWYLASSGAWRVVWWEPSLGCLGLESNSQASGTCRSAVWDLPKCLGGRFWLFMWIELITNKRGAARAACKEQVKKSLRIQRSLSKVNRKWTQTVAGKRRISFPVGLQAYKLLFALLMIPSRW